MDYAASCVVLQETVLMRVQEQPLNGIGGQQEQLPVAVSQEFAAAGPLETQTEGDVSEAPQRRRRVREAFPCASLENAEIPQRRQKAAGHPGGDIRRPRTPHAIQPGEHQRRVDAKAGVRLARK